MQILITGGNGMVGKKLTELLLARGYGVSWLVRKAVNDPRITSYLWNIESNDIDSKAIESADIIIHLAGANVAAHRWTDSYKKEILHSRIESSKLLFNALKSTKHEVKQVLCASAIGYYGDRPNEISTEETTLGTGFLSEVCAAWEFENLKYTSLGIPTTINRIGVVLDKEEGAFVQIKKGVLLGTGAVLGSGNQIVSWIHVDDLCNLFMYEMEHKLVGIYNAVSPEVVSFSELISKISIQKKQAFFIPVKVPEFVLKQAMGEMHHIVTDSINCSAQKVLDTGFLYKYSSLNTALKTLV